MIYCSIAELKIFTERTLDNGKKNNLIIESEISPDYSPELLQMKNDILAELRKLWLKKDFTELVQYGNKQLERLPHRAIGSGDKEIAEIFFLIGSALRELNSNDPKIKEYALQAAHFDRFNANIQWLLRETHREFSKDSKYFRLQAEGKAVYLIKGEKIVQPFRTLYGVVAENESEALGLIREFEREEIRDSLHIRKSSTYGDKPELPKGIYETSKLIMWVASNEESEEE